MDSTRIPGWESRLQAVLTEAQHREFHAKDWNCAKFAHRCACEVSGRELPFRYMGSLEGSVDALFPRTEPRQARSGDVVLAHAPEPSLGVCVGAKAAFLQDSGLHMISMSEVSIAWRV